MKTVYVSPRSYNELRNRAEERDPGKPSYSWYSNVPDMVLPNGIEIIKKAWVPDGEAIDSSSLSTIEVAALDAGMISFQELLKKRGSVNPTTGQQTIDAEFEAEWEDEQQGDDKHADGRGHGLCG